MEQQNRLSHALLFLGKEGYGALPLALAFAQYISLMPAKNSTGSISKTSSLFETEEISLSSKSLPESIDDIDEWMQHQPAFIRASNYMHPDIHFSYPVIPKKPGDKPTSIDYINEWREFIVQNPYGNTFDWLQFIGAENKQGNITAEECNDIIRKFSLKSFESEYKILIMWMPEYLGKEGNKLLKLIEEPHGNTLFILVAENDEQILPTILSRCQAIKIPPLRTSEIEEALITRANASPEIARQTASIAEGNYREALQLLQHASEDWQALLRQWLNAILKGGAINQLKWIEEMSRQGREKQKQFLKYFTHLLQQSLHIRIVSSHTLALPENEKDFALRLNKIASVSQQYAIIEELNKAAFYIERNANAKMLLHALTIKLYHIIQDKTVFLTA
ncbi:MAG: hypothetical protein ABJA79_01970 [Parafilimonas sp.]